LLSEIAGAIIFSAALLSFMRTFFSVLALGWAVMPVASAGSLLDFVLPTDALEVITVTDTTQNGALLRPVSPANPVFYMAVSTGSHDFGGIIAGDKQPTSQEVIRTITKVLAKQGYLPATDSHPPTLLLLWTWGTMNTAKSPGEDLQDPRSRGQLLRFMGAYKAGLGSPTADAFPEISLATGLSATGHTAQELSDLSTHNLYVAAIAAYDYQSVVRKERKLLWTTKISCPSRGRWLPEVLPSMLAIAGPNIGRETARPVVVNIMDKFKPDIEIGNPTVVEYLKGDKLPIIDASQEAAAPLPGGKK
jgi:hypothetical protein